MSEHGSECEQLEVGAKILAVLQSCRLAVCVIDCDSVRLALRAIDRDRVADRQFVRLTATMSGWQ